MKLLIEVDVTQENLDGEVIDLDPQAWSHPRFIEGFTRQIERVIPAICWPYDASVKVSVENVEEKAFRVGSREADHQGRHSA